MFFIFIEYGDWPLISDKGIIPVNLTVNKKEKITLAFKVWEMIKTVKDSYRNIIIKD